MALPVYDIKLYDATSPFALRTTLERGVWEGLQFSFTLNSPGALDFTMPLQHPDATETNFSVCDTEIRIERDSTVVWAGYLWEVRAASDEERLRIAGEGYLSRLQHRIVDSDQFFVNQEQQDIAWGLINYSQGKTNGNLGFTRDAGETASGVSRTRRYHGYEGTNIYEALSQFAEIDNGFDFEITPGKVWKVYYPSKGSASGQTFTLGGNVSNVYVEHSAREIVNSLLAVGAGSEDWFCTATASDATSQASCGLFEDTQSWPEVRQAATLQDHADEIVAEQKDPRRQPQLALVSDSPAWTTVSVGDTATIVASHGFLNLNESAKIIAITVHVAKAGNEVTTIHFDRT